MNKFIYILLSVLIFTSCTDKKSVNSDAKEEHTHEHAEMESTTLNGLQAEAVGLQFCEIEKKQLTHSLKANGYLRVPNDRRAEMNSLVEGLVKNLKVQTGSKVNKGQVIAEIYSLQAINLQEDYLKVRADLKFVMQEMERLRELQAKGAVPLKELQDAERQESSLKASMSSLSEKLNLLGIHTVNLNSGTLQSTLQMRSPIDGTVSHLYANLGSSLIPNQKVAEVIDNHSLHLDLNVYEKDLHLLKVGQLIHFTLINIPGKEYHARIFGISGSFEQSTKAIAVHADVEGEKSGLMDGMGISALVSLKDEETEALPDEAVLSYKEKNYILICTSGAEDYLKSGKNAGNLKFELLPVTTGTKEIGFTEVVLMKEMPANAKIVSKGGFFILSAMMGSASHEH